MSFWHPVTRRQQRPRSRSWPTRESTSRHTSGSVASSSLSCPRPFRARSAASSCGAARRLPTVQVPVLTPRAGPARPSSGSPTSPGSRTDAEPVDVDRVPGRAQVLAEDQRISKSTVTLTLTSWLPGSIGTLAMSLAEVAFNPYGTASGVGVVTSSEMLMTSPKLRPAARAYCSALVFASAKALYLALDTSTPVSSRSRLIPLTRMAFPPVSYTHLTLPTILRV